jgi:membrane-bound lytic murein transglycosylase B
MRQVRERLMSFRAAGVVLFALTLGVAGCTDDKVPSRSATPTSVAQAPAPAARTFETFLAEVRAEAVQKGVRAETVDRAFTGIRYNSEIVDKETVQPEFVRPIWAYLDTAVSEQRVATGQQLLAMNMATLRDVQARYGVQPAYIVAIWGLESNYGQNAGGYNVIEALASLAYGSERRATFFREHLFEALKILDAGNIAPERMMGSWAGAMGQTQFMPTAFTKYAVDYDGDGRRDIWDDLPDIFASTANYLAQFGWDGRQGWGYEVTVPPTFPWEVTELDVKKPIAEWAALGVRRADGGALPASAQPASIIAPAGYRGPAFLVTANFARIMDYNASTSYALAISTLADRVAGGGPIIQAWPREDQPLSRADRIELQTLLTARGHDTKGTDGIVGRNTRAAIRSFQREVGERPDGYASVALLNRLRALQPVS